MHNKVYFKTYSKTTVQDIEQNGNQGHEAEKPVSDVDPGTKSTAETDMNATGSSDPDTGNDGLKELNTEEADMAPPNLDSEEAIVNNSDN